MGDGRGTDDDEGLDIASWRKADCACRVHGIPFLTGRDIRTRPPSPPPPSPPRPPPLCTRSALLFSEAGAPVLSLTPSLSVCVSHSFTLFHILSPTRTLFGGLTYFIEKNLGLPLLPTTRLPFVTGTLRYKELSIPNNSRIGENGQAKPL